jgi:hypothetical protein
VHLLRIEAVEHLRPVALLPRAAVRSKPQTPPLPASTDQFHDKTDADLRSRMHISEPHHGQGAAT